MKNFFIILTLLFVNTLAWGEDPAAQAKSSTWTLGVSWVKEIEELYQVGGYNGFLQDLEDKYQMEKGLIFPQEVERDLIAEYQDEINELLQLKSDLWKKASKKLLAVAERFPEETVSKVIYQVAKEDETEEYLFWEIVYKEKDPLANEFQRIFSEYSLKSRLHFDEVQRSAKNAVERQKDSLVIYLSMLKRCQELAEQNPDHSLSKKLQEHILSYPKNAAFHHDQQYLIDLTAAKITALSEAEKMAAEIMSEYLSEKKSLIQDFGTIRSSL